MKKFVITIVASSVFLLPTFVLAYQNPGTPTGFVNDFAKLYTADEKQALETKLSNFEKQSSDEIAIATVPDLGGDTVENFAVKLFQDWQIGKKDKDNGVLLLIARDDHKLRIEVGYGLEPDLTDAQSSLIVRNIITPAFKAGDYYGGTDAAVDAMIGTLGGDPNAIPQENSNGIGNTLSNILPIIFFAFVWLISVLARSKSWWAGGVVGGIAGIVIGFIFGFLYFGIISMVLLIPFGLLLDFLVSRAYTSHKSSGAIIPWWAGGGPWRGGGSGGGFGGFGGGSSGGGGASGSW